MPSADFTASVNGEVVNTFTGSRNLHGFFGLQNHDPNSHVHFRYVRIKELGGTEPPETVFDTIGIADDAHKQNGQIFGQPYPYSLPAEEMPASGTVVTPEGDDHDAAEPGQGDRRNQAVDAGAQGRRLGHQRRRRRA